MINVRFANKLTLYFFVILLLGITLRGLARIPSAKAWLDDQLLWFHRMPVTLYYTDSANNYLVPVSRSLAGNADAPRDLFESFSEGPKGDGDLLQLMPAGTEIRNLSLEGGRLQLELSEHFLQANLPLVVPALWHTMRSLPDVQKIHISVAGKALALPPADRRMLFFYSLSQSRLVSVPANARSHMEALKIYLQGTGDTSLIGLPADVQMLGYEFDPIRSSLALNFSFTSSLRQLGTEHPESTRSLLLGLIATLTQFPEVETVTLEFDGHSRLGLGECASLIGTPQTQPMVLNDERLFRS